MTCATTCSRTGLDRTRSGGYMPPIDRTGLARCFHVVLGFGKPVPSRSFRFCPQNVLRPSRTQTDIIFAHTLRYAAGLRALSLPFNTSTWCSAAFRTLQRQGLSRRRRQTGALAALTGDATVHCYVRITVMSGRWQVRSPDELPQGPAPRNISFTRGSVVSSRARSCAGRRPAASQAKTSSSAVLQSRRT